jgi:hypothetical protein
VTGDLVGTDTVTGQGAQPWTGHSRSAALRAAAAQRAADDGVTVAEVIRNALAEYLRSA